MTLADYGWNQTLRTRAAGDLASGLSAARVVSEYKGQYRIVTENGFFPAEITGRMRHLAAGRGDFPAVGDWITADVRPSDDRATIHRILPRMSKFSRNIAGETTEEQIVAANMNTVFLVMALNHDFNLRRLERYLTMAWESGANPVILLSKADLCPDVAQKISEVEEVAIGVPIFSVSALQNQGREQLDPYLGKGQTVVFLGSSGAGKSTLVNWLCGEVRQSVQEVRADDDHGRHTTTSRELILLPSGGVVIDTPGMRELQLWNASDESVGHSFADIEELASRCRFRDCTHTHEPGCAVRRALDDGRLDQARYTSYLKLQRELAHVRRKTDRQAMLQEKARWKKLSKTMRKQNHH